MSLLLQEKDLRTRINEILKRYNLKQIDIAKDTGLHHSTLSLWLQKKVKTLNQKQEDNLEKWIVNLQSNKPKINKITNRLYYLKGKKERPNFSFDNNKGFGNLIPMNIHIELEGKKYKEQFFWDLNEAYLQVDSFAKILIEENGLPPSFESEIVNQMNKQISQYETYDIGAFGEMIKTIKLDIRLGDKVLTDSFDWDISNNDNRPEEFALMYCKDLQLDHDFILPIAFSINEQILELRKSCFNDKRYYYQMVNYNYNNTISETSNYGVIDINNIFRDNLLDNEFQPVMRTISHSEMLKYEQKEERKNRYFQRKR